MCVAYCNKSTINTLFSHTGIIYVHEFVFLIQIQFLVLSVQNMSDRDTAKVWTIGSTSVINDHSCGDISVFVGAIIEPSPQGTMFAN